MKTIIFCLCLVSTAAWGAAYKCVGADGVTVYSQTPCSPTATRVNTSSSSGGFNAPKQSSSADRPVDISNAPAECKFKYFTNGDEKGKILSDNAKAECMRNIDLRKAGRGSEISKEAYSDWKDHNQMTNSARQSARPINCTPSGFGNMRCQ